MPLSLFAFKEAACFGYERGSGVGRQEQRKAMRMQMRGGGGEWA